MSARSEWIWIAAIAIFAFVGKRRHTNNPPVPGHHHPPTTKRFTFEQCRELAAAANNADPTTAAAIAMAESSGNPNAIGDNGQAFGLWQINMRFAPKRWQLGAALLFPGLNVQAMNTMSSNGQDFSPWPTFNNGKYKQFLPKS